MNTKSVTGIPLIIEASLNGSANKDLNPNVPYSDDEIVNDAMACMDAGAALIHNHTSESIFGGTGKLNAEAIRQAMAHPVIKAARRHLDPNYARWPRGRSCRSAL